MGIEKLLQSLTLFIDNENSVQLLQVLDSLHEADAAELLELLAPHLRKKLISILGDKFNPVILTYMDNAVKESLIDCLAEHQLANALSKLDESDTVELLSSLTQQQRFSLLRTLRPEIRIALEENLAYPAETAGRIMEHEFVALPASMLVLQAATFLHNVSQYDINTNVIFLVNQNREPIAVMGFANLLLAQPNQTLIELSENLIHCLNVMDSDNEVSLAFRKYFVPILPVIDQSHKLVGVVHLHNIIDMIYNHAEEGLLQSVGVDESDFYKGTFSAIFSRLKWIVVSGTYSLLSAGIVSSFQDIIEHNPIIPVLNQILLAATGTAGMQAVTVTTRALLGKDLLAVNTRRAIGKELVIGCINGLALGLLVYLLSYWYLRHLYIAATFALSVTAAVLISNLAGVVIPIVLAKLNSDPSIGAASLLTSFSDACGLLIIFSFARILL